MKLVEVAPALGTAQTTVDAAIAFAKTLGKAPVVVKDSTGYIVNRLLVPYMVDAIRCLENGVGAIADIDTAMMNGANHPDGTARARRLHRPRHRVPHGLAAARRVQGIAPDAAAHPATHGAGRACSAGSPARASTTTRRIHRQRTKGCCVAEARASRRRHPDRVSASRSRTSSPFAPPRARSTSSTKRRWTGCARYAAASARVAKRTLTQRSHAFAESASAGSPTVIDTTPGSGRRSSSA